MINIVQVQNLTKTFYAKGKAFTAVNNINFNIHKGEILSLLGPNGSGKTTIVSMIGGYLLPTSGNIIINNINILNNIKIKPRIGVVFGGDLGFYGRASAYDNLMFFADLNKIPHKQKKLEVSRILDIVNLTNVANKKFQFFLKV